MRVVKKYGRADLATVYIGETMNGRLEFCESLQPPFAKNDKWVIIVSTLYGCPVECEMCDAGGSYGGALSTEEILAQIDYLISIYYPNRVVPVKKFKIQFARMGEPAFNMNVIDVLEKLPLFYDAPGMLPALSTVAPHGTDKFFERLLEVKNKFYIGKFQLQFSIHSTDETERDRIIPVKKWSLEKIARYGERFLTKKDRKITLNFVCAENYKIDAEVIEKYFSPEIFFIKMTPLNPTVKASENSLKSAYISEPEVAAVLRNAGFEVLFSVGEMEENMIGSNCGQYLKKWEESQNALPKTFSVGTDQNNIVKTSR